MKMSIRRTAMVACMMVCTLAVVSALAFAGQEMDTKPGPAFTTVDGKITKIEGNVYTVENESANYQNLGTSVNVNRVQIWVGKETKKLHGVKNVGDKIRAEITEGGFANSIQ